MAMRKTRIPAISTRYGMNLLISFSSQVTGGGGFFRERPVDDLECMKGMIENSNLVVSAWDGDKLIGIARSMTDFHYACYLSDLAVDVHYQRCGVGKALQVRTQEQLSPKCKLILIAAPDANTYYEHMGFDNNPRCWVLERSKAILR